MTQDDRRPWSGQYPTFIWEAGETVITEHELNVPASVRPITLYAGTYTLPGPVNLPVVQGGVPSRMVVPGWGNSYPERHLLALAPWA